MADFTTNKKRIVISKVAGFDTAGNVNAVDQFMPATTSDIIYTDENYTTTFVSDLQNDPSKYLDNASLTKNGLFTPQDKANILNAANQGNLIEHNTNKISKWSVNPDNNHYPSEKLVKDSIDNIVTGMDTKLDQKSFNVGSELKYETEIQRVHLSDSLIMGETPDGKVNIQIDKNNDLVVKREDGSVENFKYIPEMTEIQSAVVLANTESAKAQNAFNDLNGRKDKPTTADSQGWASLDGNGFVQKKHLPEGCDEVQEYEYFDFKDAEDAGASQTPVDDLFPEIGSKGIIYVLKNGSKDPKTDHHYAGSMWRWSGSQYVMLSSSVVLGDGAKDAWYGEKGQDTHVKIGQIQDAIKVGNDILENNAKIMPLIEQKSAEVGNGWSQNNTALEALEQDITTNITTPTTQIYENFDDAISVETRTSEGITPFEGDEGLVRKLAAEIAAYESLRAVDLDLDGHLNEIRAMGGTSGNGIASFTKDDADKFALYTKETFLVEDDIANLVKSNSGHTEFTIPYFADATGKTITGSSYVKVFNNKSKNRWGIQVSDIPGNNNGYELDRFAYTGSEGDGEVGRLNYKWTEVLRSDDTAEYNHKTQVYDSNKLPSVDINVGDLFFANVI